MLKVPRKSKELTDFQIRALPRELKEANKTKSLVGVGGVKYLFCKTEIRPDGTVWHSYVFNYPQPGTEKRILMGLGSTRDLTLQAAREKARAWLDVLQSGEDPLTVREERKREQKRDAIKLVRFSDFAATSIDKKTASHTNAKSRLRRCSGPSLLTQQPRRYSKAIQRNAS